MVLLQDTYKKYLLKYGSQTIMLIDIMMYTPNRAFFVE